MMQKAVINERGLDGIMQRNIGIGRNTHEEIVEKVFMLYRQS